MTRPGTWIVTLSGAALLALATAGQAGAAVARYSGTVLSVDVAEGQLVIGDMGPMLKDGTSKVTRRTIRLAPSTEFVRVKRADGAGPSGWTGDYLETKVSAQDVAPGAWVTVTGEGGPQGVTASKVEIDGTTGP
jgi:hypothetical protein